MSKDYKARFRSLSFNLKDPANPELRARVLRGELAPAVLVTLGPAELARKELSEWRKKREEEAVKAVFLDAGGIGASWVRNLGRGGDRARREAGFCCGRCVAEGFIRGQQAARAHGGCATAPLVLGWWGLGGEDGEWGEGEGNGQAAKEVFLNTGWYGHMESALQS